MAVGQVLIDSDILSAILRQQPQATGKAKQYFEEHGTLHISIITEYEILRGLKAIGATRQIQRFEEFCSRNTILPVTQEVVGKASDIYADLRAQGEKIGDADILIAATALSWGFGVATNNERHFRQIQGLYVENWVS